MMNEQEKALAAYRAMREGGSRGGKASGDAKRRSPEHYANASLKAAIGRAHAKGLSLYLVSDGDAEFRVEAANDETAKKRAVSREKTLEGRKLTAKKLG
jgi:hypothetical protein